MTDDTAVEAILAEVRARTGLDFGGYRRPTIVRRLHNRMMAIGAEGLAAYLGVLRSSTAEAAALVDHLTIKVSRFYRNAPAFDRLRAELLPALAAARAPRALRLWSAGCGHGEEAWTLAMLLAERGIAGEVLATDIDATALAAAARGAYPPAALEELPAALRNRFLEPLPGREPAWGVRAELRARVAVARDDLGGGGAAAGAFDLVACRNVLIYLDRSAQERVMARLVASLAPGGCLFLGEAEWPSQGQISSLTVVSPRLRLFRAAAAQPLAA